MAKQAKIDLSNPADLRKSAGENQVRFSISLISPGGNRGRTHSWIGQVRTHD